MFRDSDVLFSSFCFYSCGFAEFGGHIGFFPGKVGQVSSEMSAVRGFGVNGAVKL